MSFALFFQIVKVIGRTIAKNWKAVAIAAIAGAALWVWSDWRAQSAEIETLKHSEAAAKAQARIWRDTSRLQTDRALKAAEQRRLAEEKLRELLARPPEIIHVYHDAAGDLPSAIPDDVPCEDAVEALAEFLKGVGP
jgi:hypothetical protein